MREAQMAIPHLFMCPISLDLIKDPVTLSTGQTYDRSSIEKWLAAGNLTCPVTMQKLHDPTMVPNLTLRHLIDQWLQTGPHLARDFLAPSVDSLAALKTNLESHEATLERKSQTLDKVQALYLEYPPVNSCMLQLGFLPLLLKLVFGEVEAPVSQECLEFVERALPCVLRLLSLGEYESLNMLKEESKLESLQVLFEHGSILIKVSLCSLIEAISSSSAIRDLCAILGKKQRISHGLTCLLRQHCDASEASIKAISALCSLESNRENLVSEDLINALVSHISDTDQRTERKLAVKALATIELLLGQESAKMALMKNPNGINALVKMVFRVSDHQGSESAVRSITMLCADSLRAREEVICGGVLTQLLLLLQSQCSSRAKTRARMLLKLLGSKWDDEPKLL